MQGYYDNMARIMIDTVGYEIFSYEPTTRDGIVFLKDNVFVNGEFYRLINEASRLKTMIRLFEGELTVVTERARTMHSMFEGKHKTTTTKEKTKILYILYASCSEYTEDDFLHYLTKSTFKINGGGDKGIGYYFKSKSVRDAANSIFTELIKMCSKVTTVTDDLGKTYQQMALAQINSPVPTWTEEAALSETIPCICGGKYGLRRWNVHAGTNMHMRWLVYCKPV
jgi:hypothetical protein